MPLYCSQGHENFTGNHFCQQCGEKLSLPSSTGIYPGAVLGGRYRLERELGHGGFGRTYLAFDLNRFNEACVLKEFAPQVQTPYGLEKAEELFEREAGVLYKLQHPQIPRFRELFRFSQEGRGHLFLVQDYVEGQTYRALLNNRLRQGMRFTELEVTQLLIQILPVLEYIHTHGVIHRDVSPDNMILRTSDGLPVLIDFGGVKQVAATVESQFIQPSGSGGTAPMPTRLGKLGYAPPEQIQRGIVAPHSDLYALAATVLVLLTGKEPDSLIDHQTLNWQWQQDVNISPTLGAVLDKMLSHWPGDRYQSAFEVLQVLTYTPPAPPVYSSPQPAPVTAATIAVAPAPTPLSAGQQRYTPVQSSRGLSSPWGKTLLVLAVVATAGGIGWLGANLWLNSQPQPNTNPTATTPPPASSPPPPVASITPTPSPQLSTQEQQRQEALRQRRTALGIDSDFYVNLVNEAFWNQNPSLQGWRLGDGPQDEQLRQQWDQVAAQLLDKIEQANLSQDVRSKLGKYGKDDRDLWKVAVNKLHVSSRTLYNLADVAFFSLFPQQQGRSFIDQPIGQVWQAIAFDKLKALQSGNDLATIRFDSGATSQQVSDTLKPGGGKVYIAQLNAGQLMALKLKVSQESLLSIYSPSGKNPLLEDSHSGDWTGKLPESGYYEFVIVSQAREPLNYQLDLNVNNPSLPPSPQPSESVPPSSPPSDSATPSPPSDSSTASPQVSPTYNPN